jgi:hypothetical protein
MEYPKFKVIFRKNLNFKRRLNGYPNQRRKQKPKKKYETLFKNRFKPFKTLGKFPEEAKKMP